MQAAGERQEGEHGGGGGAWLVERAVIEMVGNNWVESGDDEL